MKLEFKDVKKLVERKFIKISSLGYNKGATLVI